MEENEFQGCAWDVDENYIFRMELWRSTQENKYVSLEERSCTSWKREVWRREVRRGRDWRE